MADIKRKALLAGTFARAAVWLLVVFWCLAPLVWLLVMLGSSIGQAAPAAKGPPPAFMPAPAVDQGLGMKLMSSTLMLGAFFYCVWCAAGVVAAVGMERTITAVEALVVLTLEGKHSPAGLQVAVTSPQYSAS
jgi:hypothetical protein